MKGNPEKLNEYFHEDMVIIGQDFQELGKGREACIRSYRDFTSNATVLELKVSDPVINTWENTAVATYQFEIVGSLEDAGFLPKEGLRSLDERCIKNDKPSVKVEHVESFNCTVIQVVPLKFPSLNTLNI